MLESWARSNSCLGTLFRASQFLSEELPIRLAHRVQDLGELPDGLSEMPSIKKVQDWYAQSFEVRLGTFLPIPWIELCIDNMIGNHCPSSPNSDSRSETTPVATRPDQRRPFKDPIRDDSKPQCA